MVRLSYTAATVYFSFTGFLAAARFSSIAAQGGGEAGDGHAQRRADHVGLPDLVAEFHQVDAGRACSPPSATQMPGLMPDPTVVTLSFPVPRRPALHQSPVS